MEKIPHIKSLLEKYYAGHSTLEEEARLIRFFNTTSDAGELESHRPEFAHAFHLQSQSANANFKAELLQQFEKEESPPRLKALQRSWLSIAAGILLLLGAFAIGRMTKSNGESPELTAMQTELQHLRTMVMLALMEQPRASERLRAVRLAEEWNQPAQEAIQQLIVAMNEDENINVRLAAIEVLSAFQNLPEVRRALLLALPQQESPIVQMELLQVLQNLDIQPSNHVLLELLDKPQLDEAVRNQIRQMTKSS